ncbi:hypothetical protein B0J12DRAFT_407153 [Macrophomina phaseolina]|uniref:Secreted protein n=1 Tax=Macrophomina phaseolina TaxID=35725 RepID=A0ABQ8GIX9_9PEZI|nr:hypothetical protein B0J12DRAFT_407153 [Macrophomina phaseolina]
MMHMLVAALQIVRLCNWTDADPVLPAVRFTHSLRFFHQSFYLRAVNTSIHDKPAARCVRIAASIPCISREVPLIHRLPYESFPEVPGLLTKLLAVSMLLFGVVQQDRGSLCYRHRNSGYLVTDLGNVPTTPRKRAIASRSDMAKYTNA